MPRLDPEDWILEIDSPNPRTFGTSSFARQRGWMPKVDVLESKEQVLIRVELAGVHHQHIRLTINKERHSLTIKGLRPDDLIERGENFQAHLLEIEEGPFQRELILPSVPLDFSQLNAQLKHGILSISIPKTEHEGTVVIVESVTIHQI